MKHIIILFTSIFIFMDIASSENSKISDDGISILNQAIKQKEQLQTERTIEVLDKQNKRFNVIVSKKIKEDGVILQRIETHPDSKTNNSAKEELSYTIINDRGCWDINGNRAILRAYIKNMDDINALVAPNYSSKVPIDESNKFTTSKTNYNNHLCDIITMRLSENIYENQLRDQEKILQAMYTSEIKGINQMLEKSNSKKKIENIDPESIVAYEYVYIIDVESKNIWLEKAYNKKGDTVNKREYSSIETNVLFPNEYFDVPKDANCVTANSMLEYIKYKMSNIYNKNTDIK